VRQNPASFTPKSKDKKGARKMAKEKSTTKSSQPFVVCIVPMRLGSTRLKEKMLAPIGDLSLAQRSVGRALEIFRGLSDKVFVVAAVDGETLKNHLLEAHPKLDVVVTDPEIPSGTDRVSVALGIFLKTKKLNSYDCRGVINLQGDIPFAGSDGLRRCADFFLESSENDLEKLGMITLAQEFPQDMSDQDLAAVKVIKDKWGRAIYFSRHPIPHSKIPASEWLMTHPQMVSELHIGVYGYTPQVLAKLCSHVPTELELCEGLEQLRALWLGIEILVLSVEVPAKESYRGIDTKNDLEWAQKFIKS
jgi:3-deoxy-manno-octulosonate cytidylyltransferase (CMP-KDO synthetase)